MAWQPSTGCYRCGELDHFAAVCPLGLADTSPPRPDCKPVPVFDPVPDHVAADAARMIREQMSWPEPSRDEPSRKQLNLAAEQVRASRAQRLASLDSVHEVVGEPASRT